MRIAAFLVASLLLQQANGCDQTTKVVTPSPAPALDPIPPAHRFENVSVLGATGVALDTVTGQWCRTWDWYYKAKPDSDSLNTLPTCLSLFQQKWGPAATLQYNPATQKLEPVKPN
jgi:hypothetical protein